MSGSDKRSAAGEGRAWRYCAECGIQQNAGGRVRVGRGPCGRQWAGCHWGMWSDDGWGEPLFKVWGVW